MKLEKSSRKFVEHCKLFKMDYNTILLLQAPLSLKFSYDSCGSKSTWRVGLGCDSHSESHSNPTLSVKPKPTYDMFREHSGKFLFSVQE
jgi:hypothetical protein